MPIIKYEVGKSYRLRNGGQGVIGYVFENGVAFGIYSRDDSRDYVTPMKWSPAGVSDWSSNGAFDILPPEPKRQEVWVNVYEDPNTGQLRLSQIGTSHISRAACNSIADGSRVGCHRITLRAEFEEDAP